MLDRQARRQGGVRAAAWTAALVVAAAATACSGDDAKRLELALAFPSPGAESITNSVHVWVLAPATDSTASCARLIGAAVDPYDLTLARLADRVFLFPVASNPVLEGLDGGRVLVYVEAVDAIGVAHLAGCAEVDVGDAAPIAIALQTAGAFDCADPATEEGAPCDDGLLCTVGEVCGGGRCGDGRARDCSFLNDQCHVGSCDEVEGCVPANLPNLTACDDGLFCTDGDVCTEGACGGAPRLCPAEGFDAQCNEAFCDELADQCAIRALVASCDDGNQCTLADACTTPDFLNPLSTCRGSARGGACDDANACTTGEQCLFGGGTATCGGGAVTDVDGDGFSPTGCPDSSLGTGDCLDSGPNAVSVNPSVVEGPAGDPTCADLLDNDCDGFVDVADLVSCN